MGTWFGKGVSESVSGTAIDAAWLAAQSNYPNGPYYLTSQNATYYLATDVTTKGTAFVLLASGITFNLNRHTIRYDNATPIVVPNGSFELGSGSVATGWDFSSAASASRFAGTFLNNEIYDGSYSLKFATTTTDQDAVSTSTITLEANTTYSLSAMLQYGGAGQPVNPGVVIYVELIGTGFTTRTVSFNSTNYRGIQFCEATFTTGGTPETYYIHAGIVGYGSSAYPAYIDDIKVQRTRVYGVATQAYSWAPTKYPGINQWGDGQGGTIRNGTIVQGDDGATWGHGIFIHELAGITIDTCNVVVNGTNACCVEATDQAARSTTVLRNQFTSNVRTLESRDQFNSAVLHNVQGRIYQNTITNGPHGGIIAGDGLASDIFNNTIRLKVKYTNAFAILAGKAGTQVHHNVVDCGSGEYTARGIGCSGAVGGPTSTVYSNTVYVQGEANNQEYEGASLGGVYGIQLENANEVEVYDNHVIAYGTNTAAFAFRMNSDGGTSDNVYVHDNIFEAVSNGSHAACLKLSAIDEGTLVFEDNALITNEGIVGATANSIFTVTRSALTVNSPNTSTYAMETEYSDNTGLHTVASFVDLSFFDAGSRTYFEGLQCRDPVRYGGNISNKMAFESIWTTAVHTKNGASVTVKDKDNTTIVSGTSDASGLVSGELKQFRTTGSTKVSYSPFNAAASYSGHNANTNFTADQIQTVELQIAGT